MSAVAIKDLKETAAMLAALKSAYDLGASISGLEMAKRREIIESQGSRDGPHAKLMARLESFVEARETFSRLGRGIDRDILALAGVPAVIKPLAEVQQGVLELHGAANITSGAEGDEQADILERVGAAFFKSMAALADSLGEVHVLIDDGRDGYRAPDLEMLAFMLAALAALDTHQNSSSKLFAGFESEEMQELVAAGYRKMLKDKGKLTKRMNDALGHWWMYTDEGMQEEAAMAGTSRMTSSAAVRSSAMVLAGHRKLPDYDTNWDRINPKGSRNLDGLENLDEYNRRQFAVNNLETVSYIVAYIPHRLYSMLDNTKYGIDIGLAQDVCNDVSRFFIMSEYMDPAHKAQMLWNEYAPLVRATGKLIKKAAEGIRRAIEGQGYYDNSECLQLMDKLLDEYVRLNAINPFIEVEEDDDEDEDKPVMRKTPVSAMVAACRRSAVTASAMVLARQRAAKDAVAGSVAVLANKRGNVQTARAPELTTGELERVQTANLLLVKITEDTASIFTLLESDGNAMPLIQDTLETAGQVHNRLKRLPKKLADTMNAREYLGTVAELTAYLHDLEYLYGQSDAAEVENTQADLQRMVDELNGLHSRNLAMRKDSRRIGWFKVLGAGTLAVVLLATGAYFANDELSGKVNEYVRKGLEFIAQKKSSFLSSLNKVAEDSVKLMQFIQTPENYTALKLPYSDRILIIDNEGVADAASGFVESLKFWK